MRRLSLLLRILVSATVLAVVFSQLDPGKFRLAVARSNPLLLLIATALAVGFTSLKVLRWGFLASRAGLPFGTRDGLRSYLGGLAVGTVTPGRFGELARSLYLPKERRLSYTMLALVDKVLDVWAILASAIAGAAALLGPLAGGFAAAGTVALAAAMLLAPRLAARAPAPARPALGAVATLGTGSLLRAEALAVLTFALVLVQFHALAGAFQAVPIAVTFQVLPLLVLSNLIPLTLSGFGIREGAAVLLFARYGVSAEAAVSISLLLFFLNTGIPALAGVALTRGLRARGKTAGSGAGGDPATATGEGPGTAVSKADPADAGPANAGAAQRRAHA